jgi:hypothetical protein
VETVLLLKRDSPRLRIFNYYFIFSFWRRSVLNCDKYEKVKLHLKLKGNDGLSGVYGLRIGLAFPFWELCREKASQSPRGDVGHREGRLEI